MAGRKPIPTAVKILRGNPGRRPLNDREPRPKARLPSAPAFLSEGAKAEWRRTGRQLQKLGLMTEIDGPALALYCQTWERWREAEDKVREFGMVLMVGGTPTVQPDGSVKRMGASLEISPYLSVATKAMSQMVKLLVEFGMTPSSRSKVKVDVVSKNDSLTEFLNGNRNN